MKDNLPSRFIIEASDKTVKIDIPGGLRIKEIEEKFHYIVPALKEIVGNDIWQGAKQGLGFEIEIKVKNNNS